MRSVASLSSMQGRVALVTGGAGHIGFAMADALAEVGAAVALVDLEASNPAQAADELARKYGVQAEGFAVDLEVEGQLRALPDRVKQRFGRLDVIVNCAAFVGTSGLEGWSVQFERQASNTWRRALEVNITAPVMLVQAAASLLRASGRGSVINVSSIYGLVGPDWRLYEGTEMGNPAAYAASKGALIQMTRWLSTTLAPEIRVNAIAPGGVFRNTAETFHTKYVQRTPLARMATEEDFKGTAVFLASDLSSYITGQCIAVDGGWTAW